MRKHLVSPFGHFGLKTHVGPELIVIASKVFHHAVHPAYGFAPVRFCEYRFSCGIEVLLLCPIRYTVYFHSLVDNVWNDGVELLPIGTSHCAHTSKARGSIHDNKHLAIIDISTMHVLAEEQSGLVAIRRLLPFQKFLQRDCYVELHTLSYSLLLFLHNVSRRATAAYLCDFAGVEKTLQRTFYGGL